MRLKTAPLKRRHHTTGCPDGRSVAPKVKCELPLALGRPWVEGAARALRTAKVKSPPFTLPTKPTTNACNAPVPEPRPFPMSFVAPAGTPLRLGEIASGLWQGSTLGRGPERIACRARTPLRIATHAGRSLRARGHGAHPARHARGGRRRARDEVIPAYTCYSVPAALENTGLTPVLCEWIHTRCPSISRRWRASICRVCWRSSPPTSMACRTIPRRSRASRPPRRLSTGRCRAVAGREHRRHACGRLRRCRPLQFRQGQEYPDDAGRGAGVAPWGPERGDRAAMDRAPVRDARRNLHECRQACRVFAVAQARVLRIRALAPRPQARADAV